MKLTGFEPATVGCLQPRIPLLESDTLPTELQLQFDVKTTNQHFQLELLWSVFIIIRLSLLATLCSIKAAVESGKIYTCLWLDGIYFGYFFCKTICKVLAWFWRQKSGAIQPALVSI